MNETKSKITLALLAAGIAGAAGTAAAEDIVRNYDIDMREGFSEVYTPYYANPETETTGGYLGWDIYGDHPQNPNGVIRDSRIMRKVNTNTNVCGFSASGNAYLIEGRRLDFGEQTVGLFLDHTTSDGSIDQSNIIVRGEVITAANSTFKAHHMALDDNGSALIGGKYRGGSVLITDNGSFTVDGGDVVLITAGLDGGRLEVRTGFLGFVTDQRISASQFEPTPSERDIALGMTQKNAVLSLNNQSLDVGAGSVRIGSATSDVTLDAGDIFFDSDSALVLNAASASEDFRFIRGNGDMTVKSGSELVVAGASWGLNVLVADGFDSLMMEAGSWETPVNMTTLEGAGMTTAVTADGSLVLVVGANPNPPAETPAEPEEPETPVVPAEPSAPDTPAEPDAGEDDPSEPPVDVTPPADEGESSNPGNSEAGGSEPSQPEEPEAGSGNNPADQPGSEPDEPSVPNEPAVPEKPDTSAEGGDVTLPSEPGSIEPPQENGGEETDTPIEGTPETPAEPEAPSESEPEAPNEPEAPAESEPEGPAEPESPAEDGNGSSAEPENPSEGEIEEPGEPEAPAESEPEVPAEPEAPAEDEPETPAEPEAPAEDEPEAPAEGEPETPDESETDPGEEGPAEPEAPAEGEEEPTEGTETDEPVEPPAENPGEGENNVVPSVPDYVDIAEHLPGIAGAAIINPAINDIRYARQFNSEDPAVKFLSRALSTDYGIDPATQVRIVNSALGIAAASGMHAWQLEQTFGVMETIEERTKNDFSKADAGSLWINTTASVSEADNLSFNGMKTGYEADTYGFTLGAEAAASDDLLIGAAFTWLDGDIDSKGELFATDTDATLYGLTLYGAKRIGSFTASAQIGCLRSEGDAVQNTAASMDVGAVRSSLDSTAVIFGVRGEFSFDFGSVTFAPHAGLQYVFTKYDDAGVSIDGGRAFDVRTDDSHVLSLPIGVRAEAAIKSGAVTFKPYADFTAAVRFGDTDLSALISTAGAYRASDTIEYEAAGTFLGSAKLGLALEWQSLEAAVSYRGSIGKAGNESHAFSAELKYRF